MSFLWVGLGGSLGALLRFQISKWVGQRWLVSFPVATLFINVSGAFLLGWFTRSLGTWWPNLGSLPMLALGVGMCGAYTTFSTFSYELVMLMRESRYQAAIWYLLLSFVLGLTAAAIGLFGWPR